MEPPAKLAPESGTPRIRTPGAGEAGGVTINSDHESQLHAVGSSQQGSELPVRLNTAQRSRKARPGAHFQAPQVSPRAGLVHCNTLFTLSTLQIPENFQDTSRYSSLDRAKAPPEAQGTVALSEAFRKMQGGPSTGAPWSPQSRPEVPDSFPHAASPRSKELGPSGRTAEYPSDSAAHADLSSCSTRVRRPSSESSRGTPGLSTRQAAPQARLNPMGAPGGSLLPAAVYLNTLKKIKGATSGKRIPTSQRNTVAMEGAPPLKIFCGTWNCQYQDFPVSVLTNKATASRVRGTADTSEAASSSSPSAECLPDELPTDVIARLGGDFEDLYGSDNEGEHNGGMNARTDSNNSNTSLEEVPALRRRGTIKRGDLVRSSTRLLREVVGEEQPLGEWLLPGYDLYVIALQETLGQNIFDTVKVYLSTTNGIPYKRIKFHEDKLSGLGDGAWMQFKSTSLAVWAREDLEGEGMPVSFVSSKATSVSFLSGSKGGVSVCLRIWDQFFCFIGCHMPSTSPEDRRKARAVIEQRLLEFYGGASTWREAFHHIVWMGDFNFRTQRVTAQRAVTLLQQSTTGLLAFDEWNGVNGEDMRTAGFAEAPISFPPTYKKADGRPPANMNHPKWVEAEYQTRMVTQWYKGSRTQDRVPSWTDRIFKCSVSEMSSLLRFQPNVYFAAMPNYPSFLIASDHSPVGLGIECFPLDVAYALPAVTCNASSKKSPASGSRGMQTGETIGNSISVDS